jgi:hypothetical protein
VNLDLNFPCAHDENDGRKDDSKENDSRYGDDGEKLFFAILFEVLFDGVYF